MSPTRGHRRDRTVFALSGLSGSVDLLPTVGSGIRPDLLTFRGCESARGLVLWWAPTAGGDLHPALKTFPARAGGRSLAPPRPGRFGAVRGPASTIRWTSLAMIIQLDVQTSGR